ncbi:hypothetical protein P3T40_007646 [Paraburkholderia sp. EB58]|jgi:hypothetical protein|uniref:hypothetical protein n=1 Tax=Paraburkholderia sp. EB58 TaxID=3035125 RepID=UPI003D24D846
MKKKQFRSDRSDDEVAMVAHRNPTVFIPTSVPVEVIELWYRRLASQLGRRIGRLRHAERRWKRRRLVPVRITARVRIVRKRDRRPVRRWDPMPRR